MPAPRGKAEFSQAALAAALAAQGWKVQAAYISRLESGDRGDRFEVSRLSLLAKALNVRVDWLISGEGAMREPDKGTRHPEREQVVASARRAGIGEAILSRLYKAPYDKVPDHRVPWWNSELRKLVESALVDNDEELVENYRDGDPAAVRQGAEKIAAARKEATTQAPAATKKKRAS